MRKSTPEQIAQRIIERKQAAEQRTKGILDAYLVYGNKHKGQRKGTMQKPL